MATKARRKIQETKAIDIDTIEPLNDRILVRRLDAVTVSRLIIIPEAYREKSGRAVVLATGPGKYLYTEKGKKIRRPMDVKPGDVVVFGAAWDDMHGKLGNDYALIQEDDILHKDLYAYAER